MYIEDKEEFRRQMLHFAENWLDENKVSNPLDAAFARNYASPSSPGFYISIKNHNLDEYLTDEACEFFYDNADNPNMAEFYRDEMLVLRIMQLVGAEDLDDPESDKKLQSVLSWLTDRFAKDVVNKTFEDIENAIKNEYLPNQ